MGTRDQDAAIAGVYSGPLEEFVRRRDALVKELRAAGRKDDAAAVKGLRKPSRLAWALDRAASEHAESLVALDAAVSATLDAQAEGGDIRGAIARLREAVRELAAHAARAAAAAGHPLDEPSLIGAVQAVLGNAEALDALHRARLAEIPDAGGLDFLANLPVPKVSPRPARPKSGVPPAARPVPPPPRPDARRLEIEAAARAAVQSAEAALGDARSRVEAASRTLHAAEARLDAAEARLREAETELRLARGERDHARQAAQAAATRRLEAERGIAEARARLERAERGSPGN